MFSQPAFEVLTARRPGKKGFADQLSRVRRLPDFNGEFPVATLADEITTPGEGQVRALVTSAGNPVLSTPNGEQLDAALGGLDYMVSIDIYLNETTPSCQYHIAATVGPGKTPLRCGFPDTGDQKWCKILLPVFRAGREQRSDLQIFTELGWRMQSTNWLNRTAGWLRKTLIQWLGSEWIVNRKLKQGPYDKTHGLDLKLFKKNPHGIDLGPMQPCLPGTFVHI